MTPRFAYFEALEAAILQDLVADVRVLLTLVLRDGGPEVLLYAEGQREREYFFLKTAVEASSMLCLSELLTVLKDCPRLFNSNEANETIFLTMVETFDRNPIYEQLAAIATAQLGSERANEWFMQPSYKCLTALHVAAEKHRLSALRFLLDKIATMKNATEWLNLPCHRGNTALHYAVLAQPSWLPGIALLMNHDADMMIKNMHGLTVMELIIWAYSATTQIELYAMLNETAKARFFSNYRETLIHHPPPSMPHEKPQDIYFKLAAKQSLVTLLLAKHEFSDSNWPIREEYVALHAKRKNKKIILTEKLEPVPEEILSRMPVYRNKLPNICPTITTPIRPVRFQYQLLNEDRNKLARLGLMIEMHKREVLAYETPSVHQLVTLPVLFTALFIFVAAIVSKNPYFICGTFLLYTIILTSGLINNVKQDDPLIPPALRRELLLLLQDLTENLRLLQRKSTNQHQYRFTDEDIQQNLEFHLLTLNLTQIRSSNLNTLNSLQPYLRTVERDMNRTRIPYSFFSARPKENTPLLPVTVTLRPHP